MRLPQCARIADYENREADEQRTLPGSGAADRSAQDDAGEDSGASMASAAEEGHGFFQVVNKAGPLLFARIFVGRSQDRGGMDGGEDARQS